MGFDNHPLDSRLRDQGTYRKRAIREAITQTHDDRYLKSQCNNADEYEDALIAALDAGLTSEEISDIILGSV